MSHARYLLTHQEITVIRSRSRYVDGSDDNVEIDDDANLSPGDDGCWVQGWLWVAKND
jgi:hypothetical protein